MRRVLSTSGRADELSEGLVAIVRRFDDMVVEAASLDKLTTAAADMLSDEVFVLDLLNDRFASASPAGGPGDGNPETGHALLRAVNPERSSNREVLRRVIDDRNWGAAILEHGQGRLGVVWTGKTQQDLSDSDELVLERFAQAAAIAIQQDERKRGRAWRGTDPSALELLLTGGLDVAESRRAERSAGLNPGLQYRVIAMAIDPPQVSVAVATAAVGRALERQGGAWRTATLANVPMGIIQSDNLSEPALDAAIEDAARSGWRLAVGVGDPAAPGELDRSTLQARQALAFGASGNDGGVTFFSSLGALHLLASIPAAVRDAEPDVAAVLRLTESRTGVDDLALLIAYCATGSLRQTGERMFLHHSSVEYRLRRIESVLGFPVTAPTGRFRAQLAAMIVSLSQATGQL